MLNIYHNATLNCLCEGSAWRSELHVWLVMWRSLVRPTSKAPVVSLSKELYLYCLELVDSRNGFERDITIEIKLIEGLMEDWLNCHISLFVKYRQLLLWKHTSKNIGIKTNTLCIRSVGNTSIGLLSKKT